jgi:hypothetical protein
MKLKLIVLALFLAVTAAAGATTLAWNIWYAENHTPWTPPDAVEQGRLALAAQLSDSVKREAEIEKIYWDQPGKLEILIAAHQQREDKLAGNSAAYAIVAHDKDAIEKLRQRIAAIEATREAQAEAEAEAAREAALEAKQQAIDERNAAHAVVHP